MNEHVLFMPIDGAVGPVSCFHVCVKFNVTCIMLKYQKCTDNDVSVYAYCIKLRTSTIHSTINKLKTCQ